MLFNPEHNQFSKHYAVEDEVRDDLIQGIQFRAYSRQIGCFVVFVSYALARNILWNRGIGGKFFHYTRYTTLPLFLAATWYCLVTKTQKDLKLADVYDYNLRRNRFKSHSKIAQSVTQFRVDYIKTVEDNEQGAA